MADIILQLLTVFAPIIREAVARYYVDHGTLPTDDQVLNILHSNIDKILADGRAWKALHRSSVK